MLIDKIRNRKNLSIADAIAYGYSIFKSNIVQIMYIVLIIYFPLNLISGYISMLLASIESGINMQSLLTNEDALIKFLNSAQYLNFVKYNIIKLVLDLFLIPFGTMAVIAIVKNVCEEKYISYRDALKVSFSCGGRFLWIRLIYSIIIGALYLLGVIPGVILSVYWYFNIQALVIDEKKGIQAFKYSRNLVSGRWFRTFFMLIVFRGLSYGISYLISVIFMWGSGSYFVNVLVGVLFAIISTIFISAETVVYINYQANIADKSKVKALRNNNNQ